MEETGNEHWQIDDGRSEGVQIIIIIIDAEIKVTLSQ